jgi:hypothetical protein
MLARKTNGALRNCAGIFGAKCEKTPRCVSSVSAELRSWRYRPAVGGLQPGEVDAALRQRLELVDRIVVAHDADELHGRQVTRRGGEERTRPAEHVVGLAEWSFDRVERDGADDEDSHWNEVRVGLPGNGVGESGIGAPTCRGFPSA